MDHVLLTIPDARQRTVRDSDRMTVLRTSKKSGAHAVVPATTLDAVLLDMDGVVTDTAGLHFAAWKSLFDAELPRIAPTKDVTFSRDDYRTHVDGRSREAGIEALLASRGVVAPEPTLVAHLSRRKQQLFEDELERSGARALPGAADFVAACNATGLKVGLVTSSTNAASILAATGIADLFDAIVDGNDARTLGLPSKPDPAIFLECCSRLGVESRHTAVVEDSIAGLLSAAIGGFSTTVGIGAKRARVSSMFGAGADIVVPDLGSLVISGRRLIATDSAAQRIGADPWVLRFFTFVPEEEGSREALCTLANGYWGTRGSFEFDSSETVHYAGTYLAGIYDTVVVDQGGARVTDEELVNAPNWLPLALRIDDEDWLRVGADNIVHFYQELDLRRGILTRTILVRDQRSRICLLTCSTLVSQSAPRLAAQRLEVTAVNWSGIVAVAARIDGRVSNSNDVAHPVDAHVHLVPIGSHRIGEAAMCLESTTRVSNVRIAVASRITMILAGRALVPDFSFSETEPGAIALECTVRVGTGETVVLEKIAAVATSRDRAAGAPVSSSSSQVLRAPDFAGVRSEHVRAWRARWRLFDVRVSASEPVGLAVHLNTFHVLQSLARPEMDIDAGVPARGLHGEGYDGHIFWDELFVYPALTVRSPQDTRSLLRYRSRRLPEARAAAKALGKTGAMFPWQSGTDGRDVTPRHLFNPLTDRWMPDNSYLQRHVGLAVAFSAWQYYEATGDRRFLIDEGAPLIVEVARFFASLADSDPQSGRFSIRHVMGPDEFHDGYPDTPGQGVTDNTYTNVMAAWVLRRAADATHVLRSVPGGAPVLATSAELARWASIARRLRIVFNRDGTLSQFAGYDDLRTLDLEAYRARFGSIARLDLILNAEEDSPNNYTVAKQPDALMLLYLLSAEELREILTDLGYQLDADTIRRTVTRYTAVSTYGSTLSNVVHSWLEARTNRALSWQFLLKALSSDLEDPRHGNTRTGVHIAAMAGSIDLLTRCYAGMETRSGKLWLHPQLPSEVTSVRFTVNYREQQLRIRLTSTAIRIRSARGTAAPIAVVVDGREHTVDAGDDLVVFLPQPIRHHRVRRPPPAEDHCCIEVRFRLGEVELDSGTALEVRALSKRIIES